MRTTRTVWIGVVCGLLASGAWHSTADAADTPPVLKQTALVEKCTPPDICIGNAVHLHKGLGSFSLKNGQTFRINRRFLLQELRYIDLQGEWFDEIQRPKLHLINAESSLFSRETLEVFDDVCKDRPWSECFKIRDFPIAFGIHDLENAPAAPGEKPTITPHAFVYIPMRFKLNGLAGLGDEFILMVLHIPATETECAALETSIEQKHCVLTVRLNGAWQSGKYSRAVMRQLITNEYRRFFDHIFDGMPPFEIARAAIVFDPSIFGKFKFFLHNDIIHGKLQ